jgi:hypothetical protein
MVAVGEPRSAATEDMFTIAPPPALRGRDTVAAAVKGAEDSASNVARLAIAME